LRAALLRARELEPNSTADAVSRAIRTLRTLLLQGAMSGDKAAGSLAMHRRTLTRRLAEEGTIFQKCLDRVRFTVAKELIDNSEMEIYAISSALSYSNPEAFFCAFRRWTGMTPSGWKEARQLGETNVREQG
jgi:AraC-like DNA-binding protein